MDIVCSANLKVDFVIEAVLVGFRDRRTKSGFSGKPCTEFRAYAVLPGGSRILLGSRPDREGATVVIEDFVGTHATA